MYLVDNRNCTDPFINLATEEYLVRHLNCSQDSYLFLYINEPCIVLGKNQSIYREVNFDFIRNNKLKLCRRISGGGTVYQDEGNLNFAFITSFSNERVNNYAYFNRLIIDALSKAGLKTTADTRNNILFNNKKISGNAQFTDRKNMISHGTLLFDADLDNLRSALKENPFSIETKAPRSVSSSVTNMKGSMANIESTGHLKQFIEAFAQAQGTLTLTDGEWDIIQKTARDKFESFEWVYGRSPLTTITRGKILISIDEGIISAISNGSEKDSVWKELIGVRYCSDDVRIKLSNLANAEELMAILF